MIEPDPLRLDLRLEAGSYLFPCRAMYDCDL